MPQDVGLSAFRRQQEAHRQVRWYQRKQSALERVIVWTVSAFLAGPPFFIDAVNWVLHVLHIVR